MAIVGAVVWGYLDANKTDDATTNVYLTVIDPYFLSFDTMESMAPYERGQLFIRAKFDSDPDKPIKTLHFKGDVMENDKLLEHFDGTCQRKGSEDLTGKTYGNENTCYLKLKTSMPVRKRADGNNNEADILLNDIRRESMKIENSSYSARSARRPFTYVVWINQAVDWLMTPFKRAPAEAEP